MRPLNALVALGIFAGACVDTGRDHASIPLFVAGTDVMEPVEAARGIPITIERADLAFGPLYLCAGASAGDLCDAARLEWLETIVIDATNGTPERAGELVGVTGSVRSYMYDLGISSQLTSTRPFILDAAEELGGASLVVEGTAEVDGIELPFTASVPIQQTGETELGVPVIRKSTSERFFRDVGQDEPGLLIRFDAPAWLRAIDLSPYVARETCVADGPAIACDGTVERSCEGGVELEQRDCAELQQVCLPERGCAERLQIEGESEAFRSLRNAVVSQSRPSFDWGYAP
jgi:hypothetical protein